MLTLADVVDSFSKGVDQQRADKEHARYQQQAKAMDEANAAAAAVIDRSKAQWAMNGAQGEYKPNDQTMFDAAMARSAHLVKAGMFEHFIKNEAQVEAQRMRVRANALQAYEADGDIVALVNKINPTIPDGKDIKSVTRLEGGQTPTLGGAANAPEKLRITYTDGTTRMVTPHDFVTKAKLLLQDPIKTGEMDVKLAYATALEKVKAAEQRATKKEEAETREEEGKRRFQEQLTLEGVRQAGQDRRNERTVEATRDAARIRSGGGGGGGGDASKRVQSVRTGADGYDYIIFRDGTRERVGEVKSGTMAKRVDAVASRIQTAHNNSMAGLDSPMSMEQARAEAKRLLEVDARQDGAPSGSGARLKYDAQGNRVK